MPIDFEALLNSYQAPQWTHSENDLAKITSQIIQSYTSVLDQIVKVQTPTIDSVVEPYAKVFNETAFLVNQVSFYLSVSADKALRDALTEAEKQLDKFYIEIGQRKDVFEVFHKLDNLVDHAELDPETSRFIKKTVLGFTRMGLNLPEEKRTLFKQYEMRLSELSVEFGKTMNEQNEFLLFTKDELEGVPEDVISEFETVDGKLKMTYKYPDLFPVLKYAVHQDTRKRAYNGNQSKCASNGALLEEMVRIRCKKAQLLGYPNFSAFVLEERMAKTVENVNEFLTDLRSKLTPLGTQELTVLKQLKNRHLKDLGLEPQEDFYQWDMGFYNNLMLQEQYQVDHQKIQQYFPLDFTITQMLGFYERILDVKFHKIEHPSADIIWHEDVKVFGVFQGVSSTESPQFMGYIYFDLHPRDGKYGHAANFGLGPGYQRSDGTRQYPITALVCNFTKPTKEKPSLLKHDEVTTFFHELGHGVHNILSQTKYSKFHGTSVPRDFVEAPSQMLEFWTWTKSELKALSSHYQTGEPISDELVDQLIKSKNVNNGLQNLRQLHFGLFDMALHTIGDSETPLDLTSLWNDMRNDISLLSTEGNNTPGYASFGHIAHGYESGYYGYLYSQVFAVDIYYSLFKEDPMNEKNGKRYRDIILKRGNSREMKENLEELLGRKVSSDAFMEEMGC